MKGVRVVLYSVFPLGVTGSPWDLRSSKLPSILSLLTRFFWVPRALPNKAAYFPVYLPLLSTP
jgi:hypothetical protein